MVGGKGEGDDGVLFVSLGICPHHTHTHTHTHLLPSPHTPPPQKKIKHVQAVSPSTLHDCCRVWVEGTRANGSTLTEGAACLFVWCELWHGAPQHTLTLPVYIITGTKCRLRVSLMDLKMISSCCRRAITKQSVDFGSSRHFDLES